MKNKIHGLHLDALRLCFEVGDNKQFGEIAKTEIGGVFSCDGFNLQRIEGRHFEYVYLIILSEKEYVFGELRFGLNRNDGEANTHKNGKRKAWINVENKVLYTDRLSEISTISRKLNLEIHNITALDIALDMTMNISTRLRKNIRCQENTVILNGKAIMERAEDRPEITYTNSGDLDRDKYRTVNVKQKKAMKDKSQGSTLIAYDKAAEIRLASKKEYIMEKYGNPEHCFRLEVHLNNENIKQYLDSTKITLWELVFNKKSQLKLFMYTVNSIIRFVRDGKRVDWLPLSKSFLTYITTLPTGKVMNEGKPL